jgi:hypothetical protein
MIVGPFTSQNWIEKKKKIHMIPQNNNPLMQVVRKTNK